MDKICSLCKNKAAWCVIDNMGFMEPGTLCPKHYTDWRYSPWEWCLIFHLLTDGDLVTKNYTKERLIKKRVEETKFKKFMPSEQGTTMDEAKKQTLMDAMESTGFNVMKASRILRISKATMYRMMEKYGIKIMRQIDPKGGFK